MDVQDDWVLRRGGCRNNIVITGHKARGPDTGYRIPRRRNLEASAVRRLRRGVVDNGDQFAGGRMKGKWRGLGSGRMLVRITD